MRILTEIIIHCTATRPDWWKSRSTGQKVAEVRRWHVEDRGWSDIGYHYLIDRNGSVAKGRPIEKIGAHVKGHNEGTIGISLFGGHEAAANDLFSDHFTPEQETALRDLISRLVADHGEMAISGHNDYANKGCPGFNVVKWLARGELPAPEPFKPAPIHADPSERPAGFVAAIIALLLRIFGKGK